MRYSGADELALGGPQEALAAGRTAGGSGTNCSAGDSVAEHDQKGEVVEQQVSPRRCAVNRASHASRLTQLALALLLAAHSAAHFVAVARIVRSIGLDLPIELVGGLVVTSSSAVAMLLAIALTAAGTGFLAAAGMLFGREPAVGPLLMVVAGTSLVLTVVGLWGTAGGALVNLAVLTVVPGMTRLLKDQQSEQSVFF